MTVYFPKWYISGKWTNSRSGGGVVGTFVNLNFKTYLTFLNWMPQALKMSEDEIISHAGLDSAVFLRIYTLGFLLGTCHMFLDAQYRIVFRTFLRETILTTISVTRLYNANKFARLVRKRDRLQNWLDYNQLKFERYPEKRPTSKKGFLGLWRKRVDSIDFYKEQIKELDKKLTMERQRILKDPKAIIPTAFVSFNSRWGAAVCAQTQQSKNPILWLTN